MTFRYAARRAGRRCDDIDLTIAPRPRVAIVGETGSGKTTFAKLVTRLDGPGRGTGAAGSDDAGWAPLSDVAFESLRARVVMVPQDGFLFDADRRRQRRATAGRASATPRSPPRSPTSASTDWVDGLPDGVATPVGQRGESLSAGERQLVAVARAYVADPDLLVLDEATSAVDPATERAADARRWTRLTARPDDADHRAPAVHRRGGPTRSSWSTPATWSQRGRHAELVGGRRHLRAAARLVAALLGRRAGTRGLTGAGPRLRRVSLPASDVTVPRVPPVPAIAAAVLAVLSAFAPGFFFLVALGFSGGNLSGLESMLLIVPLALSLGLLIGAGLLVRGRSWRVLAVVGGVLGVLVVGGIAFGSWADGALGVGLSVGLFPAAAAMLASTATVRRWVAARRVAA